MKITLKSTFNLDETDIETQNVTLRALLAELSTTDVAGHGVFFDRDTGEVYPDCGVQVNGQSYRALADGLDTKLKDGDKVEIILLTLAGG